MKINRSDNTLIIKSGEVTVKLNDSIHIADFAIPGPGEYDVQGVSAIVLPEKIRTAVLGIEGLQLMYIDRPYEIDKDEENFANIDVLTVRVTSKDELKLAEQAAKDLEPSGLVLFGSLPIADFQKELNLTTEALDKLSITASNLPEEGTDITILS